MLEIRSLIPTHNSVRDPKGVRGLVQFLREGRIFRCQNKPITIVQFEDGKQYVHDGHRRLCSMILAGGDSLLDCEYKLLTSQFDYWKASNPFNGWYTPFDPRIECRLPDFFDFKDSLIMEWNIKNNISHRQNVLDRIINESNLYKEPRRIFSLKELVEVNFPNGCN